ncbi:HlyD family type I secretion periplasmic adaptor subunit [Shimia sp.]|uniref:HlyD family type I secretion periplasmic adaptor subunit n=1 Tax=Shimia sp. TaxID=1954381 RepID=UPI003298BF96
MSETKKWSAKAPVILGAVTLLILVGGFGVWAVITNISGAIIASGRVEVDRNRQIVQHLDGGIVTELNIDEGDTVEKGQVMVRLDDKLLMSTLIVTEGQLWELVARRGRLEAERDGQDHIVFEPELLESTKDDPIVENIVQGQERLFEARLKTQSQAAEQLSKRAAQIENQIDGIDAQLVSLSTQLDLIRQELGDQKILFDKGLAQATRILALRREEAGLAGRVGELTASRAQAEGRVTEIELEKLNLVATRREEAISVLRDLRYRELELTEQRRSTKERLSRLDIRAPVSGIVYGMAVNALLSVIRPAEPLMFIVPQDRPLVVEAQVPTIHIDQVYPGQEASLRFSAFDQRTTPELIGEIVRVSPDAFQDEVTKLSYYRVEIHLSEGEITKLADNVALIPGMPVDAFLRTQSRTPLAYLVKPLTDYFTKAFREG